METKVINPYKFIGLKHQELLDFIGTNLPPNPTFDQLNETLVAGSLSTDPNYPVLSNVISGYAAGILPNAYNGFMNKGAKGNTVYTETQQQVINSMLKGISSVPPTIIDEFLEQAEENIVNSGLTYREQIPLFIASVCARADFSYWLNQIETPGVWAAYLDPNPAINITFLPDMVSAAAQGSLLTYGLITKPEVELLDAYVSLIGATGLATGKVVFGWLGAV